MMVTDLSLNGTAEVHAPANTARTIFRESIASVAANAKETLPSLMGALTKPFLSSYRVTFYPLRTVTVSLWVHRAIRICITSWAMSVRVLMRTERQMVPVSTSSRRGSIGVERLSQLSA
jgi:hypothetical protein